MKGLVGALNQEKALVGAFSLIVQLRRLIVCSTNHDTYPVTRYTCVLCRCDYEEFGCSAVVKLDTLSHHVRDCGHRPKYLLVTTTGPSAEYWGEMLGLYKEAGTYNGAPYYIQLDDVSTKGKPGKIYKHDGGAWEAGPVLGGAACSLLNSSATATVPESGWQYGDPDKGVWLHDAGLRVTRVGNISPLLCGTITISATGEAARVRGGFMGQFQPTGQFSAGRQVFHFQETGGYLTVYPDFGVWGVSDSVNSTAAGVRSGCAPGLCPALARAAVSDRHKIKSWQYAFNGNMHDGSITVKCSVHSS